MTRLTTVGVHFTSTGDVSKRQKLFRVNPDVDAQDTLNTASDFISTVMDVLMDAAMGEKPLEGNNAFMVVHTLESAKAALDAVWGKLEEVNDTQPGA